jgi:hypothetical protein
MSTLKSHASQIARATQLSAGLQKHLASETSFPFASQTYTPVQITNAAAQLVSVYAGAASAKATYAAKVAAERAQAPSLIGLMTDFEEYVRVRFANSPDVLADFGIAPKKAPTPLTAEEKAVAAARRASTRKARGITGSKAKKSIKGSVLSAVLVPVTAAPPVTAPSAEPTAPAAGSAPATGTTKGG